MYFFVFDCDVSLFENHTSHCLPKILTGLGLTGLAMAPCETQQDSTAYVDPTIDHRDIKTAIMN